MTQLKNFNLDIQKAEVLNEPDFEGVTITVLVPKAKLGLLEKDVQDSARRVLKESPS